MSPLVAIRSLLLARFPTATTRRLWITFAWRMARQATYSLPLMAILIISEAQFTITLHCKPRLLLAFLALAGWPLTASAIFLWQPTPSMAIPALFSQPY